MPKGIPLTEESQIQRKREIYQASVDLFSRKGFQETSMREIAAAVGMGKSSLYDYFRSKDEILVFVIEEEAQYLSEKAEEIAGQDLSPEERLRQIMQAHMKHLQTNRNLMARLSLEAQNLKPESLKRFQELRYRYQNRVASIIEEGIAQGCFRPVSALPAARLLINSLLSVLYTTRPVGNAEEMMREAMDIFLYGVKR